MLPVPMAGSPTFSGALAQVQAVGFAASLDRFIAPPLLVTVAAHYGASLATAALLASGHYLLYGLMQPVWGMASDRLGRVRVMRITLAGTAVAGALAAIAPTLTLAIVLRALTGACVGGLVPTSIVYLGETVPFVQRSRALDGLVGMTTLGTAAAATASGVLAQAGLWRVALALPAVLAAVLLVRLRLAEPPAAASRPRALAAIGAVLRRPWPRLVMGLALVEGAVIVGPLTFFAPALEHDGHPAAIAGLSVALYGTTAWATTIVLRRTAHGISHHRRIALGTVLIIAAFACCAAAGGTGGIAAGTVLLGAGFATTHPMLQAWATDVAPDDRATMIALFAGALFVGGALTSVLAAGPASAGRFDELFGGAAALATAFGVLAVAARRRYRPAGEAGPARVASTR
jgi:predicted MFS family arabinose efflux permease